MRPIIWEKQGLIISPDDGPDWRRHLSGAMHVMPKRDGIYRVYLTGVGDDVPTPLSVVGEPGRRQIGWLDLDEEFRIVREYDRNPVLPPGEGGTFDCEGVVMPMVLPVDDELYMYYAGFGPGTGQWLDNAIGLAISSDGGDTWRRPSRAPLPMRDDADPSALGTVWVIRDAPDRWRMWYTATFRAEFHEDSKKIEAGQRYEPNGRGRWNVFTHLKYATSSDGVHWDKPADSVMLHPDEAGGERLLTRPMVIQEADGYRMWFSVMRRDTPYRIGYAESPDGLNWERKESGIEPSPDGWDKGQIRYAMVLREDDRYLMFYNADGKTGTGLAIGRLG